MITFGKEDEQVLLRMNLGKSMMQHKKKRALKIKQ